MNKISQFFAQKAYHHRQIVLYPRDIALQFVEKCKEEDVVILGIDGFFLHGEKIQPSLEHSIDFTLSSLPPSKNRYNDSIHLLNRCPSEMLFEIVCKEEHDGQ